ncbi:response regulator [Massilia sp. CMS3.1]|uniref:response regulator n=1 Tax=Massilia sp. CMS3.1 TaxID=3373083 RepID=UPI003EE75548
MLALVRRSISVKFMAAVMATTFVAVVVSGLANLAYDIHDFQDSAVKDLSSQADLLARVSTASLEFQDAASAQTLLNQLQVKPQIEAAAIYGPDGLPFAAYSVNRGTPAPATLGPIGTYIDGNNIVLSKAITRNRDQLGTVYLRSVYPIDERIYGGTKILAGVTLLSLVIAGFVSLWLQSAVTRPVQAVTQAVRELIAQRDFGRRVAKSTEDETGELVDAFNTMLGELGSHAALLEASNASLQREVGEREKAERELSVLNASLEERIDARSRELEKTNEQLRQAQKMEAIGQLTGGVAHDFNNVLQVISGNLQLLSIAMPGDAVAQRRIETAKFATDRGAKLSSQLLAFARRQPLQPSVVSLGRVVRAMDDMLRRALGETVELDTVVAGGLWNTLVDPNQIENAILNLAINARDAMGGSGKLTIELGNAMLDEHYTRGEQEVAAGQYVLLAVSDTGCGMPPEVVERAFEPFFTTKREGEGTGLGLSMVFGFVKQSSGHLKIYSEVGSGTTVRIYLPRSHQPEQVARKDRTAEAVGGSETILVVEDDLSVQATVVDMLRQLGYRVLSANDGTAALHVVQSGVPIDMLFTDVVMPGPLRSPELARQAKLLLPKLAVLFTSGYTQNAIVHGGRLDPGVELISKPYRRDDLARKIRMLLGNAGVALEPSEIQTQSPKLAQPTATAPRGRRILLVEDEPDNRMILCEILSMLGHQVAAVPDAEQALTLFVPDAFDVLITDLNLPGISGTRLAANLRVKAPGLQVIIASGMALSPEDLASGSYAHMLKPYQLDNLQKLLDAP